MRHKNERAAAATVLAVPLTLTLALASCRSGQVAPSSPGEAHAAETGAIGSTPMLVVDGNIYLGGQPGRADFEAAKRDGALGAVINYRGVGEHTAFDQALLLADLDVPYHHIPFNGAAQLSDEVFDATFALIDSAPRPLVIHCASGNRVGAVWMAWRMLHDGFTDEAALEEARRAGLRSEAYIEVARGFVSRRRESGDPDQ